MQNNTSKTRKGNHYSTRANPKKKRAIKPKQKVPGWSRAIAEINLPLIAMINEKKKKQS